MNDLRYEILDQWNKKKRQIRLTGIIVGIVMIVCAIFCIINPSKTITLVSKIASLVIIISGIYFIVDYMTSDLLFPFAGNLALGIVNVILGLLLLFNNSLSYGTFTYLFGLIMLIYGINKLSMAHQLSVLGASHYGFIVVIAIINIIAAILFMLMPFYFGYMISYIIAFYLLINGIDMLIESITMNDLP